MRQQNIEPGSNYDDGNGGGGSLGNPLVSATSAKHPLAARLEQLECRLSDELPQAFERLDDLYLLEGVLSKEDYLKKLQALQTKKKEAIEQAAGLQTELKKLRGASKNITQIQSYLGTVREVDARVWEAGQTYEGLGP